MRFFCAITLIILLVSCNSEDRKNLSKTDSKHIQDVSESRKNTEHKITKSEIDFLCDCDSLEFWKGGIQGVEFSDSTAVYGMGQCFSNLDFDIILFSKKELEFKDCIESKNEKYIRIFDNIPSVEYYAFEIPKTFPLAPGNETDTYDYVYPSEVKIYKKFDDGWYLIRQETINNFEQLGRLKMKTIFKM